jgi:8-oxo-dGTP pyrophosphatase MutT (NUDIX family)
VSNGSLQVLLVTTRNTRRWIVPKGWPIPNHAPPECAAREAFEEAGVEGTVGAEPLGAFTYEKLLKSGETVTCSVEVFPLAVARQRRAWPEKRARQTDWCSIEEALSRIAEPELRSIIAKLMKKIGKPHSADVIALSRKS